MVDVKEFPGLRSLHPAVFCTRPYDVIGDAELVALRQNPDSVVHIILPEGDNDKRYENARNAYTRLSEKLVRDEPSIYFYEESNAEFKQRGFIFGVSLDDYEHGAIKKHEQTREKPLQDRMKHIETLQMNTGLVWTVFKHNHGMKTMMDIITSMNPIADFEKYGYRHRFWKLNDLKRIAEIKTLFNHVPLYIADGHHRIAAAYHVWKKIGGEDAKYVMVFAASDDEVRILPYNRVITTVDHQGFMDKLSEYMQVELLEQLRPPMKHEIQMYYNAQWWSLIPKHKPSGLVETLDVSILQSHLLQPVLGIYDIRNDPTIFFIGGNVSRDEYQKLVDEEHNAIVFYLHPTSIQELEAVADAARDMPPKSTWFDPKLLTGLVFHTFDD